MESEIMVKRDHQPGEIVPVTSYATELISDFEIVSQCRERYRVKPALREITAVLKGLGRLELRDWEKIS
jgi:hypothetical protein